MERDGSDSDAALLHRSFQVEAILATKRDRSGGRDLFYIKWVGFPPSENTWEAESDLVRDGLGADLRKFRSAAANARNTRKVRKRLLF
jgi:hypothetical protein